MTRPWRLAAALVGLAAMLLAGCSEQRPQPVTSQTSKFRPADEASPAAVSREVEGSLAEGGKHARPAEATTGGAVARPAGDAPAAASSGGGGAASGGKAAQGEQGEVAKLLAEMDRLAQQPPRGANEQEQMEDFVRTQQRRLALGQKALALSKDRETKRRVARAMYEVHAIFGRLGVPSARAQLLEFAKSLEADPDPEIARLGRHIRFDANVARLAGQPLSDGRDVLAEVEKLLAAEKGALSEATLELAGQAGDILHQLGLKDDAAAVYKKMGQAAADDPQLKEQAARYQDRAALVEADLLTLVSNVLTNQADAEAKLLAVVDKLLADLKPSRELFSNLQQVAQYLEMTGHFQAAEHCYEALEKTFAGVADERLAQVAAQVVAGGRKRLGLIGQPLEVDGVTLDGKPLDWSAYQGKVVLLDFWATWCGPCLEELPNIRKNFEQFHAKGFEVIGVNLNTNLSELKQFLSLQELPWTTITSPVVLEGRAGEDWSQLPMAAKCGVDAIPFLVLIGKDGKVDSIHVRGSKLRARLVQLLGEPITTDVPPDPTQPPAAPPGNKTGRWQPGLPGALAAALRTLPVALAMLRAEPPAAAADQPSRAAPAGQDSATSEVAVDNPYLPKPDLTPEQLVTFIEKMLDKPRAVQSRPGFAAAVAQACDRLLAADTPLSQAKRPWAIQTKLAVLHRAACDGDQAADTQLAQAVLALADEREPALAKELAFYRLEQRLLRADQLPPSDLGPLVDEVLRWLEREKTSARHLRLASACVAAINRLEENKDREQKFAALSGLLMRSTDPEVAAYGRQIQRDAGLASSQTPAAMVKSGLIGQPLALGGVTARGTPLDPASLRGKVVLVDFWATWCGPCQRELPALQSLLEKHRSAGLAVLGVSLDDDLDAVTTFLDEHKIGWETLMGDPARQLAQRCGVRAIPTYLLLDREGNVVAAAHQVEALAPQVAQLLGMDGQSKPSRPEAPSSSDR